MHRHLPASFRQILLHTALKILARHQVCLRIFALSATKFARKSAHISYEHKFLVTLRFPADLQMFKPVQSFLYHVFCFCVRGCRSRLLRFQFCHKLGKRLVPHTVQEKLPALLPRGFPVDLTDGIRKTALPQCDRQQFQRIGVAVIQHLKKFGYSALGSANDSSSVKKSLISLVVASSRSKAA